MPPLTYCNPLPLPHYQRGRLSITEKAKPWGWINPTHQDYREMADPTCIRFENRYYLFPSCGMLWHSDDLVNWTYHPIEPFDCGYAPTVAQINGYLYLTACGGKMYRAKHPFGPWEFLGQVKDENGTPVDWADPMLYQDDDGHVYCYNGLGTEGIYVVRMQSDDLTRYAEPRRHCFRLNPEHAWERHGEYNQNPYKSYLEGAWMTKHEGRYYLQYSGPGTEFRNYCVACYVSDTPVGPWRCQNRNPILHQRGGLVNGTGHHSVVKGPNGTLWCFYTTLVRIEHMFERRVAMDPVGFDEHGEMFVNGPSETPQFAPGVVANPAAGNDAGLLPLSVNCMLTASSHAPGREPQYANDNNIRTWWQPADNAPLPQYLELDLFRPWVISAARTLFADRGLDYDQGIVPAPYLYRLEGSLDRKTWFTVCDRSANACEQHMVYDTFAPAKAQFVRLVILGVPPGMTAGVWEFTVFGQATP